MVIVTTDYETNIYSNLGSLKTLCDCLNSIGNNTG